MAITQLFFRKGNFLAGIELDVIITEGTTATSVITKNPVQSGADFNDHIIVQPMAHRMSGVVSNAASTSINQFSQNIFTPRRDREAWEDLLELMASGNSFELVQGLKTYPNVQFISLSEDQDKSTYNALFFNATFQEIITPSVQPIISQFLNQDISDKAIPSANGGLKQPIENG